MRRHDPRLSPACCWPLLLLTAACATPAPAQKAQAVPSEDLNEVFKAAIHEASVYKEKNVRPLYPLQFTGQGGTALVSTLTSGFDPGNAGKTYTFDDDTWVTAVPEVQPKCQKFPSSSLIMSLRQLIGLQPNTQITQVVVIQVTQPNIFRPAVNPDPTTPYPCAATAPPLPANCGQTFPPGISQAHQLWMANWVFQAWSIEPSLGYPWTHLGYTYNWTPGEDRYGASEYVIPKGTPVFIQAVMTPQQFCYGQ